MKKLLFACLFFVIAVSALFAGTFTSNLGLYVPAPQETGWGGLVNNNFRLLDTKVFPNTSILTFGSRTAASPATDSQYAVMKVWSASHLTRATLLVIGGTSITGRLEQCAAEATPCQYITDSLTVLAGAEGTFVASSAQMNTSLSTGNRIYFVPTAVEGSVTSLTVDIGGVIP